MTDFRKLVLLHTKTDTAKKLVPYLYTVFHSDQEVFRCLAGVPNETDQKRILNYLEKPYTSHPEYFIRTYYFYRLTLQHPKYKKYMMQNNFSLLPTSDIAKCLLVLFAKRQNYQK